MFSFIALYSVLGANLLLSFIVALCVWIRSQKYYKPCLKKDKNGKVVNLHDIYDPFHPHDKVYFIQLWFGAFFCFLIKFISSYFKDLRRIHTPFITKNIDDQNDIAFFIFLR